MKKNIIYLIFILFSFNSNAQEQDDTSIYFFIRHAEKVLHIKNPDLTPKGRKRAVEWSNILQHYTINKVISTSYKRTIQTANPIAKKHGIQTEIYDTNDFSVQEFIKTTKGQKIVIVGHSNTIPSLVNKFIKEDKYKNIDEIIYGNLYIVTISNNKARDILLTIE